MEPIHGQITLSLLDIRNKSKKDKYKHIETIVISLKQVMFCASCHYNQHYFHVI
jgi:hypothetical protein